MSRSTRAGLRLTLVATLASLALLAPTLAVAEEPGITAGSLVDQSEADSPGVVLQAVQDRLESWTQLLQERLEADESASVDGKAGSLADTASVSAPSSAASSHALLSDIECEDGRALIWPCEDVNLLSFVPNVMLGGAHGNDIWGWTDPETGGEYAIMGTGYTTAIVDVTEPTEPVVAAIVPSAAADYIPLWRDVKVHDNHAYIVSEHTSHGMQVVDLTELRDLDGELPATLEPVFHYEGFGNAHNIAINEDTGYAYAVGSSECDGGLYMLDISDPAEPEYAGCFDDDGYTHDVQCVIYHGPKGNLRGNELCFASNEDTVTIVDVTNKKDFLDEEADNRDKILSRTGYDSAAYTHQGWLTPDHEWFVFGDELDEQQGTVDNTTTYIMNVEDPTAPGEVMVYAHETESVDHNLYLDDDYVWQANYAAGLRILDYTGEHGDGDITAEDPQDKLDEVGFFEVVPELDPSEFAGAWSVYPYFESGTIIVSTLEQGLFVLETTLDRPALEGDTDEPGTGPGRGQGPPEGTPVNGEGNPEGQGNDNGPQRTSTGHAGGAGAWTA